MENQTISTYLKELGAKEGKPGGGSAAGIVGAMSASLANMVSDIQKEKKKFAAHKEELEDILEKAKRLCSQFEQLSQKDAEAFEPVSKAYGLPKGTEEEKEARQTAINEGLKGAAEPPLEMMRKTLDVLDCYQRLAELDIKGSIVNDIAVGVLFAKTALEASYLNVLVNADMLKDDELKHSLEGRSQAYLVQGLDKADTLYADSKYYLTHKKWPETRGRGTRA